MPNVNPEIMRWAREAAGLSLDEAAQKLGIASSRTSSREEKLLAYERGDAVVSNSLLLKMSEKYRRSLLVFYMSAPPMPGNRGSDFRTRPGGKKVEFNANLDALIREILARHELLRELFVEELSDPISFVGSLSTSDTIKRATEHIIQTLEFNREEFRSQKTFSQAFSYLRRLIEESGVFVLLTGNLGSHHSNIDPKDFGGYAVADQLAPLIIVNDQDSKAAWSFTALHELTHVFLGASGVSTYSSNGEIEDFCNTVASQILVSDSEIIKLEIERIPEIKDKLSILNSAAEKWKVSRSLIAFRLNRLGVLSYSQYGELAELLHQEYIESRAAQNGGDSPGPDYYVVKRHRLGKALLATVQQHLLAGSITPVKAGRVLGVKPRNLEPLFRDFRGSI